MTGLACLFLLYSPISLADRGFVHPFESCIDEIEEHDMLVLHYSMVNRDTDGFLEIEAGEENYVSPGPADQGQATRFQPGWHFYPNMALAIIRSEQDSLSLTIDMTVTLTTDWDTRIRCRSTQCVCPPRPKGPEGEQGPTGPTGPTGIEGPRGRRDRKVHKAHAAPMPCRPVAGSASRLTRRPPLHRAGKTAGDFRRRHMRQRSAPAARRLERWCGR
jgi:hypothetical protein